MTDYGRTLVEPTRWVAPLLPEFFRLYPDIAVDLHLTDSHIDLTGEGFDAALRIAVMGDSSLVARLIVPVRRFVVASPTYLARHGRPQHPHDLGSHRCLSYLNRPKRDTWRFTHRKTGEEYRVMPTGPLRGTSIETLLPTALEGLAIIELPEFAATEYFRKKQSSTGNVIGMISTHFTHAHRPRDHELRFLDLLARQSADYLERKHETGYDKAAEGDLYYPLRCVRGGGRHDAISA